MQMQIQASNQSRRVATEAARRDQESSARQADKASAHRPQETEAAVGRTKAGANRPARNRRSRQSHTNPGTHGARPEPGTLSQRKTSRREAQSAATARDAIQSRYKVGSPLTLPCRIAQSQQTNVEPGKGPGIPTTEVSPSATSAPAESDAA